MKTKTYNKEEIVAFLLGALNEQDTERLDELSFTDDEFADELKAAEKDLIDLYVNGELAGENLEKFESFYLASPLRREKVEFAGAFQIFAKDKAEDFQTENREPLKKISETQKTGFFSKFFTFPRLSLQWGFAVAAILFLIFGGFVFWENARLRDELSQTKTTGDEIEKREAELALREKQLNDEISNQRIQNSENESELTRIREERAKLAEELKTKQEPRNEQRAAAQKQTPKPQKRQPSVFSFVLAPTLRGNNQLPTLKIPPKTDSVAVRLELESNDYELYRVALRNPSNGQTLWQSGKIKSNAAKNSLNITFPAKLLKSQVYSLEITGLLTDGTTEIISDYSFRSVR